MPRLRQPTPSPAVKRVRAIGRLLERARQRKPNDFNEVGRLMRHMTWYGRAALPHLEQLTKDADPAVAFEAAKYESLTRHETDWLDELNPTPASKKPLPNVHDVRRTLAIVAGNEKQRVQAHDDIALCLKHPDEGVRELAARALVMNVTRRPDVLPFVLKVVRKDSGWSKATRAQAIASLYWLNPARKHRVLAKTYRTLDEAGKQQVFVRLVRENQTPHALGLLVQGLADRERLLKKSDAYDEPLDVLSTLHQYVDRLAKGPHAAHPLVKRLVRAFALMEPRTPKAIQARFIQEYWKKPNARAFQTPGAKLFLRQLQQATVKT